MIVASVGPLPFPACRGIAISAAGGVPPYVFTPASSPPNPPGVFLAPHGHVAYVSIPPGAPADTVVRIRIGDRSGEDPITVAATVA